MDRRLHTGQVNIGMMLAAALVAALVIIPWYIHNDLTDKKESVHSSWANVQSTLQRRADLIPALLKTVSQAMEYESETLESLAEQQAQLLASHTGAPPKDEDLNTLAEMDQQLAAGSRQLLVVAGSLPELRATDQFLQLQSQLEGTENRINVTRIRYNEAVRYYNGAIRGFIGRHVANSLGLEPRPYFEASAEAQSPVPMEFQ